MLEFLFVEDNDETRSEIKLNYPSFKDSFLKSALEEWTRYTYLTDSIMKIDFLYSVTPAPKLHFLIELEFISSKDRSLEEINFKLHKTGRYEAEHTLFDDECRKEILEFITEFNKTLPVPFKIERNIEEINWTTVYN